jgi:cytochrome c-type biogenesis protein CcmH
VSAVSAGFVALCVLLLAASLWFVLRPLLRRKSASSVSQAAANVAVYRDQLRELEADLRAGLVTQAACDQTRLELEARLLQDVSGAARAPRASRRPRAAALAFGVAIASGAAALYWTVGTPLALQARPALQSASHDRSGGRLQDMVDRLAARLKQHPEDPEGWAMLARSYGAFGRYAEASAAYLEAVRQDPGNAQLLADHADALAMAQGRLLQGEPEKLIARALAIDPDNVKALALAGSAAFERDQYAAAVRHWERILTLIPAEASLARSVQGSIAEARALAGKAPGGN